MTQLSNVFVNVFSSIFPKTEIHQSTFWFLDEAAEMENLVVTPELEKQLYEIGVSMVSNINSSQFKKKVNTVYKKCVGKPQSTCLDMMFDFQRKELLPYLKPFQKNSRAMEGGNMNHIINKIKDFVSNIYSLGFYSLLLFILFLQLCVSLVVFCYPMQYGQNLIECLTLQDDPACYNPIYKQHIGKFYLNVLVIFISITILKFHLKIKNININGFNIPILGFDIDDLENEHNENIRRIRMDFDYELELNARTAWNVLPVLPIEPVAVNDDQVEYIDNNLQTGVIDDSVRITRQTRNRSTDNVRPIEDIPVATATDLYPVLSIDFELRHLDEDRVEGGKPKNKKYIKSRKRRTRKRNKSRKSRKQNKTKIHKNKRYH